MSLKPAFVFEKVDLKRGANVALVVTLTACCMLWEGCAGISQNAAAASPNPAQQLSLQPGVLPNSSVGASYHAVLSVNGAHAPYKFMLAEGALPPGLSLNPFTGYISGTPTQAGIFPFAIGANSEQAGSNRINDEHSSSIALNSYRVVITGTNSSSAVTVQVSPAAASVTAGGTVKFSAAVSNTPNTGVVWSASAGSISADGLFTAPASGTTNSISISAVSVADSNARANAVATITSASSTFSIVTASVPTASEGIAYATSLSGRGGRPPYRWSIVSGSLPAGLQLNSSTGLLSGSASKTGDFTFSVLGTDASSHTASRSFSLVVSAPTRGCGPPTYNCSRTDTTVVQMPAHAPSVGNLTGANTIVTDPDFGNRIVRITDWNTDPGLPSDVKSFVSAASGSADENLWNLDSTMFILQSLGSAGYPYTFDPSTMQSHRMYVSSNTNHGGMKFDSGGVWSRVDPNVLYTVGDGGTSITKYDFSDRTNPPSPQPVVDFSAIPNCLPAGFTATWKSKGGVSAGDTVFAMAYSNAGNQGTGVYAVAYKVGSGCTAINTRTGQVWGEWGAKGTINIPDRWTIHNVKMSKDGNWLVIATAGCLISSCSHGPYFWQIGTTNVSSCGDGKNGGQKCGGHWTEGYSHWINNYDGGKFVNRPFADPTLLGYVVPITPAGIQDPLDQHASWNNADPADSVPFFLTFWSIASPFPGPWYNEITGVSPDGSGKVWRFAHSFITGKSQIFNTQYGIGSVSQDGRFFIFSSDWMGTLGSQSGTPACTVGKDCRGDVFVLELN